MHQGRKPNHNIAELEGIVVANVAGVVFHLRELNVQRFCEEQNVTSAGEKLHM